MSHGPKFTPAQVHQIARRRFLELHRPDGKIQQPHRYPNAWGVVMDVASPELIVTIIAMGDGTTSVYYSSGGGIIGAGGHELVAAAREAFLAEAQMVGSQLRSATDFSLPQPGKVRFHLLTDNGMQTCEVASSELIAGDHPLSSLGHKGNEVMQQCKLSLDAFIKRGVSDPVVTVPTQIYNLSQVAVRKQSFRDNIRQAVTILCCVLLGALGGPFFIEARVPGIIMGGFIGLVAGFLASGIHLMVLQFLRRRSDGS